ncbi:hypothetical protein [Puniceicoccus vermicola]|uniref:Quinol:cytochrome C oxidoreductase n=1 Tax=Puniceicoccus vermicola TaxID=388746 RepID=A0A7X1E5J1_9BACT|nr:hypothetical protein [Puniceicoccus vermicola]MBC2603093.1 hypothetical protein [Puniceicoccus vermicola]
MSEATTKTYSGTMAGEGSKWPLQMVFLVIGLAGMGLALIGLILGLVNHDARPVLSWLIGVAFWLSILLGSLFMVLLFHLFDAGWSVIARRQLEHLLGGLKWVAIIFLPLLMITWFYSDPGILWKWMNPDHMLPSGHTVAQDVLYESKSAFLNRFSFTLQAFIFFGAFLFFASMMRKHSFGLDRDGDARHVHAMRKLAAAGIFVCALSATFGAINWFMSLEYHWFSTMYGVWFFAGCMRSAIAVLLIILFFQSSRGDLKGIHNESHNYLLGCMALAFTVFWAYISFSQYFLIYQANIPEETFWYKIRHVNADGATNSWWWIGLCLIFCHFLLPFLFLLFYKTKVKVKLILFVASWILVFHLVDLYFNILPTKIAPADNILNYEVRQFSITFWDLSMIVGLGGIVLWAYRKSLSENSPIPLRDPRIDESIHCHE